MSTRAYQQRNVWYDYLEILVHAHLRHELQDLLVLEGDGVVVVELDVDLLHVLAVHEWTNFSESRLLAGQEPVRIRHVEDVDFGETHHARLLPILETDGVVPQPQVLQGCRVTQGTGLHY